MLCSLSLALIIFIGFIYDLLSTHYYLKNMYRTAFIM